MITFELKGRECLIDDDDADLLPLSWHPYRNKNVLYIIRTTHKPDRHGEIMHRVIMERILGRTLLRSEKVDHWNRNGLDNTRGNLRLATNGQNGANSAVSKNNKLGIKGVTKEWQRYRAQIRVNGKKISLGSFATAELAHTAYLEAAKHYFGDFANGGE